MKSKNIYCCQCISEDFYGKSFEEIEHLIFEIPADYSSYCIKFKIDSDIYIVCYNSVCFVLEYYVSYFTDGLCVKDFCCYDCIFNLQFRTICDMCKLPLQEKIFKYLIKIR